MSEYQYLAFRAIDRPVEAKNLAYMRKQSSRAEITPWSFENEYHFGDFGGDAQEMLRRGYDMHLHYANFGIRTLMIRHPKGLPNAAMLESYLVVDAFEFLKDKKGPGGILSISPYYDGGSLDELWELDTYLDRLLPLRAELLDGDLRPLYLAHLAAASDQNNNPEETPEAPVPAGLKNLTSAQEAFAEFYGLRDTLLAAAAKESLPLATDTKSKPDYETWLKSQPEKQKHVWLEAIMENLAAAVRAEMLAKYRDDFDTPPWPTTKSNRTIAQLEDLSEGIAQEEERKATALAQRQKEARLAAMANDPDKTLRETEKLVEERTATAYLRVAELLTELRDALSATEGANLAEKQAQKLRSANPTRKMLIRELRNKGFLPK
jgi:hypothetical protein